MANEEQPGRLIVSQNQYKIKDAPEPSMEDLAAIEAEESDPVSPAPKAASKSSKPSNSTKKRGSSKRSSSTDAPATSPATSPDSLFDDHITLGQSFMDGDTLLINRRPTTPKKEGPPIKSPVQFPSPAIRGRGIRTNLSSMAPFIEAGGARVPRVLPKDVDRGARTLNVRDVKKEQEFLGVANVIGNIPEEPTEITIGSGRRQRVMATGARPKPVTLVRQGPSEWAKPRTMPTKVTTAETEEGDKKVTVDAGGYVVQGASYKNPYSKFGDPDYDERTFKLADPDIAGEINIKDPKTGKDVRTTGMRVASLSSEGRKLRGPRVQRLGKGSIDEELLVEDIVTRTRAGVKGMMQERPFGNEGRRSPRLKDIGSGVRPRRDLRVRPATEKEKEEGFTTGPKIITPRGGGTSPEVFIPRMRAREEVLRNKVPEVPPPLPRNASNYNRMVISGRVSQDLAEERRAAMAQQATTSREGQVMTPSGWKVVPSDEERAAQLEAHRAISPETVREVMASSTLGARTREGGMEPPRFGRRHPIWQRVAQQEAARRGA
jgi:hypothetical protein